MTSRPRRSALYIPANNERAIEKARSLPCDAIILDLEDSVAPDMKNSARESAVAALRTAGFGQREVVVRINDLGTPWGRDDLAAIRGLPCDAVLVPKIHTADDVRRVDGELGKTTLPMQIWVMIETAQSIFRLDDIAATARDSRLSCLVVGGNDLAKELGMIPGTLRAPLIGFLGLTVAAARCHKLAVLDGVFNNFQDSTGFMQQCQQGVEFGFDGKTLIHPNQIDACNLAFSPSESAVSWAQRIKIEFAKPENANRGALRIEGAMVERLHLEQAERLLAIAAAIETAARNKGVG